jgi:hypothetical protein
MICHFMCDYGHEWFVPTIGDSKPATESLFCELGHRAVVRHPETCSGKPMISIVPAEVVVPKSVPTTRARDRFLVMITDLNDGKAIITSKNFILTDALEILQECSKLTFFAQPTIPNVSFVNAGKALLSV